jgi:hypothetical protein
MGIYALQKRLNSIKYSQVVWTALVLVADIGLMAATIATYDQMLRMALIVLAALVTLLIPYFFGEKSIKKIAITGVVVVLISGGVFGNLYLMDIYDRPFPPAYTDNELLMDGSVTPYSQAGASEFHLEVTYRGDLPDSNVSVRLTIIDMTADVDDTPIINNTPMAPKAGESLTGTPRVYETDVTLPPSMYEHYFHLYENESDNWTAAWATTGPMNAPFSDYQGAMIMYGVMTIFLQVGMLFLIGLLMYWWLRKGKIEREKWKAELNEAKPKKGGFKCTECGAEVGDDDKFCPKCGVKFDEDSKAADGAAAASGEASSTEAASALESKPESSSKSEPEEGKEP